MSRACCVWLSCWTSRPSSMILLRRSTSPVCSRTIDSALPRSLELLISVPLLRPLGGEAERVGQLLLAPRVLEDVVQHLLELLVSVRLGQEVGEPLPSLDHLAKRVDLLDDLVRLEVVEGVELQVDPHLRAVPRHLVLDGHRDARRHAGEDLVEVIPV